jgi:serine/threonine-protein kinase
MLLQNSETTGRRGIAAPGGLLLILVTLLLLAGERMSSIESLYYDFLQRQQPNNASDRILLVDTGSTETGSDLWDATQFSPVISALNAAGAALIVPLQAPPASAALPDMKQLTALAELEQRARQLDSTNVEGNISLLDQLVDFRLQYEQQNQIAATVKNAGNVILPMTAVPLRRTKDTANRACIELTVPFPETGVTPSVRETAGELMLPNPLCSGANNGGYAEFWPDPDGVVRRTHLLVKSGKNIFPALPLAVAQADGDPENLEISGAHRINIDGQEILTGPGFTRLIRYYGGGDDEQAFKTVSTDELLNGEVSNDLLRDRIILLGDIAENGEKDYRTPFNQHMPPALLLATTLSNLLQMDFMLRPYWLASVELAVLILLGVTILLLTPSLSGQRALIVVSLLTTLLLTTEAYLLLAHGIWVQLVTATLFTMMGIGAVHVLGSMKRAPIVGIGRASSNTGPSAVADIDELDLAFSVLRQQPPTDETKERLYEIAMIHGKSKEFAKAERVLAHLASIDTGYRDVSQKLQLLSGARNKTRAEETDHPEGSPPKKTPEAVGSGRTLGRYVLEKTLGRGAMATVYLGVDPKINRKVAIKTIALAEEFSDADLDDAKAQFLREAESAGRLNHPNIIAIYDTGEDGNVAYLAMEYFSGKALNHYAQADNLLPPKWVLELTARAADALHYAHGQNVVHRDIKPANLMYDAATDTMKITDFGIARLTDTSRTKTGIILGTPSYMSPEQLTASAVTGSSDLYSLGITMYQLLTGTTPFRSDSIPKLMDKIMNDKHKPVSSIRDDLPTEIDEVLAKMLSKRPEDRFPNGRALALALRDCISSIEG